MSETVNKCYTGTELADILAITPKRVSQLRMAGKLTGVERRNVWCYSDETISHYRRHMAKQNKSSE